MQGIDHEDHWLTTLVLIFMALEAMFFVVVFSMKLVFCLNLFIAVLGILVAGLFVYLFKRRGDYIDRWGAILYALWNGVSFEEELSAGVETSELAKHYEGCVERRKRKWLAIIFGWEWLGRYSGSEEERKGKFGWLRVIMKREGWFQPLWSPRWVLVTLMTLLVIVAWILVIIWFLDC